MLNKIRFFVLDYILFILTIGFTIVIFSIEKKKFALMNRYDLSFSVVNCNEKNNKIVENLLKANLMKFGIEKNKNVEKILLFDIWEEFKKYDHVENTIFLKDKFGNLKISIKFKGILSIIKSGENTFALGFDGSIFSPLANFYIEKYVIIYHYKIENVKNIYSTKGGMEIIKIINFLVYNMDFTDSIWKIIFENEKIKCLNDKEKIMINFGDVNKVDEKLKNLKIFFKSEVFSEKLQKKKYKNIDVSLKDQIVFE